MKLRERLCAPFDGLKKETVDELEQITDDFAIEFASFIDKKYYQHKYDNNKYAESDEDFTYGKTYSIKQLLEIFKKEKKTMTKTPEEKAEELIKQFLPYVDWNDLQDDCTNREWALRNAKQCALIAVTEILNALDFDFENPSEKVMYFLKVKIAIEDNESK